MPAYDFVCDQCEIVVELQMKMSEREEKKNSIKCEKCGNIMLQKVAPLRFQLKGYGWYASELTQGIDPYAISDKEIAKNLDDVKRIEDDAATFDSKYQGE